MPLSPPIRPMLAKLSSELPLGDYLYEPKWDGFRVLVFRDQGELYLQSRSLKPLLRYFPELEAPLLEQLPRRCVVDGELVIVGADGLDFDTLQLRLHPAASRIEKLAAETPARIVLWDVLADEEDLRGRPFRERRERLLRLSTAPPVHITPSTLDPEVARDWFERFGGAGFDGVIAKPLDGVYEENRRVLVKLKHVHTVDCAVAGFRWHKRDGVGSLILGLFSEDGRMHQIGICSGFSARLRSKLVDELEPLREDALKDHPWAEWVDVEERRPGMKSRWNADKDLTWEPVRLERVVEVKCTQFSGGRFRHPAKFLRFRPDREPRGCRFDQLSVSPPVELQDIFGASSGSSGS